MNKLFKLFTVISFIFFAANIYAQSASITWPLTSSVNPNTPTGNIQGQAEIISAGPSPSMSIFAYNGGQRLWVGNTGWIAGSLDASRYIEFDVNPTSGNSFNVNSVSFDYGDFPTGTDYNRINSQVFYSTDNWQNSTGIGSTLIYKNTSMQTFSVSNLNVSVASGQTFRLRIYIYAVINSIAGTPTFAIHNSVVINGTTAKDNLNTGSICGMKFNDANGNGILDNGETGLPNWTINLKYTNAAGTFTLTTTTDKNGNYCFTQLAAGVYEVSEVNQFGWQQTLPSSPGTYTDTLRTGISLVNRNFGNKEIVSGSNGSCITWSLLSSGNVTSVTGNIVGQTEVIGIGSPLLSTGAAANPMSVYGYSNGQQLWVNNNGGTWVPDPPAPATPLLDPLRYIQFDAAPTPGNSFTVTNVAFNYGDLPWSSNFNILAFKAYYSTDGWNTSTALNTNSLTYLNTTMSLFSQSISAVVVPSGQTFSLRIYPYPLLHGIAIMPSFATHNNVTICGTTSPDNLSTGSICGMKFNDLNGNGIKDSGEPGLQNWTINLTGATTATATTDKDGNFCFNNLVAGTYTVAEVQQSGWTQTAPTHNTYSITLAAGENKNGIDFGNKAATVVGCVDPPAGMVAWWSLDETSGTTSNDLAGFDNAGIRMNGPVPVAGKVLSGLQFDGIDDYIEVPDHSELNFGTGNFSIDAWIQTSENTGQKTIINKVQFPLNQGYSLYLANGEVRLIIAASSPVFYVSSVHVADGNWHHIAVTVDRTDPSGIKFYKDGIMISSSDPTTNPGTITAASPLRIGSLSFTAGDLFKGVLDEIELFNRVLTSQEVNSIYSAGSAGKCKPAPKLGSICGMKFNDLNGNGIKDSSEVGLPNWTINLTGTSTATATTDKDGKFCFDNLAAGTYTVAEVQQNGWTQTAPVSPGTYTITLASGQNIDNRNFGNTNDPCLSGIKNWSPLGTGINNGTNGEVWALAVIGSNLYVGGNFTTAGGITANHIAKWNGSSWSALISTNGVNGINGNVTALAVMGTDLYAGGWFTTAGGVPAENIAKWDGTNWTALGGGLPAAGAINALAVMGNNLYATSYILASALGGPGNLIVKWDGSNWSAFSVMNDYVSTFLVDGSDLYVGGQFTLAGNVPANHIAKWDGSIWSSLGIGTDYFIGGAGLKKIAGNLYVGGRFTTAGGNPANFIAKWNGSIWSSFGSGINNGMNNEVEGLAIMGNDLYASGSFTTAEGVNANSVAKWDGTNWSPLGNGMNDGVWRLAVIGNVLYAGGIFTSAGGGSANHIAKYSCSVTTSVDDNNSGVDLPQRFLLDQNYPNPFNPTTKIRYAIPKTGFVRISVYDILGREIKVLVNEEKNPGNYELIFNTKGLSSGIYFYTIRAGDFVQSKKMILMK